MNQFNDQIPVKRESGTKKFWRIVLGTMVGFFLSSFIVSILSFFMMLGIIASFSSMDKAIVKDNSILQLNLQNEIKERAIENPFEGLAGLEDYYGVTGLNDILKCIKSAAIDPRIKGICLHTSRLIAAPATVKEIRDALVEFKKSGKFVYAYSDVYAQNGYYLSSVADQLALNKKGDLEFKGIAMQVLFYKGLLDKLDVDVQVVRHGQFKSAVEPYIMDKMSAANREQMTLLSNALWKVITHDIATSRKISIDSLNLIADHLLCSNATNALDLKLVDKLCYKSEFDADLKKKIGVDNNAKLNLITINEYKNAAKILNSESSNKIALVYAVGQIVDGKGSEEVIGSETLSKEIRKAYENKDVKAIVLRVNSPGGSALASEVIWNEIELEKKAGNIVVTSMGDYAASGGYYISCNSDYIVAEPNTLTGSIGVFGMIPSIQDMLKNKLGITVDVVKTNPHADWMTGLRKLDEVELKTLQASVEEVYETFTHRVAVGRKMDISKVDEIGQGRVWAGSDALELKLIDKLGSIDDAVAKAAELAKISDYQVVYYPRQKDWLTKLLNPKDLTNLITEVSLMLSS
ncbi:MAG: signal peptide peptidase SppA [Bacteroidales bacterium]